MLFSLKTLVAWTAAVLPFALAAPTHPGQSKIIPLIPSAVANGIPGAYIVVYESGVSADAVTAHQATISGLKKRDGRHADVDHIYDINNSFKGYSIKADDATIADIAATPEVAYVEHDQKTYATVMDKQGEAIVTQNNAPWGLGRLSDRTRGSSSYSYDDTSGSGTTVYVVDTGIMTSHRDFGGRASWGANFIDNDDNDGHGHGTFCAGVVGGKTYGVAKNTRLIAVKVLANDGFGTKTSTMAGMNYVANNAQANGRATKSVMSMSVGGGYSAAENAVAAAVHNAGVTAAVSAGNDDANAANYSPASAPEVLTVGATDSSDRRSIWSWGASNWGGFVDIFAAGTSVVSLGIGHNTDTTTMSGTSMATPHVGGLAAYLIALEGLSGSDAVTARIKSLATRNIVTDPRGSQNLMAFNGV